ncbi:MAG: ABC transporter permease [Anaerolineae bacterium]|nr:ABC transporter permease [Anaerolineae bacterium]MDW8067886.1 ABC transporter permease [Anaerolineae bacterium]
MGCPKQNVLARALCGVAIPPLQAVSPRRPLRRQPLVLCSLLWLIAAVLGAMLAPYLTPVDPLTTDPSRALLPPGSGGLLGTDFLGRDVLARLLWGGRWTLGMGVGALTLAVVIGLPLGLAAGSAGGWLDGFLMRLVDAWLAFPGLLLAMAGVAVLGPGLSSVTVAVGLAAAAPYARVVRAAARAIRAQPYIEAARAIGASPWRIALRHILPNTAPALLAFAATQLGWVLLNGAALHFLGLGVPPGVPEWGAMLAEGRAYLRDAPWAAVFPGAALTLTILAANLLGDRLGQH